MQRFRLFVPVLTLLLLCIPSMMKAQLLQGTINGTTTDATGAVIPNATVTVTRNGVNDWVRTIQTNSAGSYTITNLPAATYTISVAASGFQAYTAENVVLFVAQTRTVNASLKPGSTSQKVIVSQVSVSLDTTTSALAGTISGTQVRELQLNNRNFEQLVTLQPGVVSGLPDEVGFGLSNTSSVAVNGVRDTANNWTVDGADINDSGSNATLLNVPSVDAIQEFTLERSSYDAGFGRSGGGQILVATKSGTSSFHGDAYEFNRNNIFNANSYFNKQTTPVTPRAIERYNDYGFTIGGPLYIPKVFNTDKSKMFFFWSEEWRKVSAPSTDTVQPPTTNELNGIFPGNLTSLTPPGHPGCITYDPTTNQSTISGCSQNAGVYLTNLYDLFPANTSSGLYTFSFSSLNNTREDLVRFDWNITQKLHFFGRAMQDETPENFPTGLFAGTQYPNVAGAAVNAPGENVVGNLTWTITPRMVNEAEFAYSQGTISSTFEPSAIMDSPTVSKELTNKTTYTDPYGRIPNISLLDGTTGLASGVTPYTERNLDLNFFDNFSVTLGQHTIRTGVSFAQMLKTENASSGAANFQFTNFQDFLLGNVLTYTQSSRDTIPDLHYLNFEAYVQDDWKVSQNLTLNLGFRYSYFPSPADVNDTLNNFDPLVFDPTKAPIIDSSNATLPGSNSGNFVPGQGIIPATYVNGIIFPTGRACTAAQAIAPGVTCSPYGAHVNPDPKTNFAPRFGFAYAPSFNPHVAIHGGFGIFYDRMLNGIWEQNAFQDPPLVQTSTINNTNFDDPLGPNAVSLSPSRLTSTGTPTMKNPSYIDYNLSIQDELLPNTVMEIAFVGSLGRHLLGERNLNQPTLAERESIPLAQVNAVVPYLGYAAFASRIPEYTSNYNSLQVSLNHRTQHGLTIGIAYTWGRTLTNQGADRGTETYNTYDPNMDYGPAPLNQPQTFVANYVYMLPFYQQQHGLVGHVLGGWELSGITQFDSGQSFAVNQALDNFDCITPPGATSGCIAGTYPGGIEIDPSDIAPRPDLVAAPHLLKKQTAWFATSSFKDAIGHFGSSPNGIMVGPGLNLWDLSAIKNINMVRDMRFQFRAEFFNAFNHPSFSGVQNNTDFGAFGQVTSAHDPREIQLGGKFYF